MQVHIVQNSISHKKHNIIIYYALLFNFHEYFKVNKLYYLFSKYSVSIDNISINYYIINV